MKSFFSYKKKRLWLPPLLVTLPVALVAILALFYLQHVVHFMIKMEMERATLVLQDSLQTWQEKFGIDSARIAQDANVINFIRLDHTERAKQKSLQSPLNTLFNQQTMDSLIITDNQGIGLISTDFINNQEFDIPSTLLGTILTQQTPLNVIKNINEIPSQVATIPVFDQIDGKDRFIGVVISIKKLDYSFLKQLKGRSHYELGLWYHHTLMAATHVSMHQLELPIQSLHKLEKNQFFIEQIPRTNDLLSTLGWLPIHSDQERFLGAFAIGMDNELNQTPWQNGLWLIGFSALLLIILASTTGWQHERQISINLQQLINAATGLCSGNWSNRIQSSKIHELNQLNDLFNQMAEKMALQNQLQLEYQWHKEGISNLHKQLGKNNDLNQISKATIEFFTTFLDAVMGVFYVVGEEGNLQMLGSYAYHERKNPSNQFIPGQGVIGQVLLEKKWLIISEVPQDYSYTRSALGQAVPNTILIFPFLLNGEIKAILELGTFSQFTKNHLNFLDSVAESVAMSIMAALARARIQETLKQLQEKSNAIKETSQALQLSNKTLKAQKQDLQLIQAQLLEQQEELRVSNEELEEQAQLLEEQKQESDRKNVELIAAQTELQRKAKSLQVANQYKSEFLSNMSHELRTPLNSLLILAKSLMDNVDNNLLEYQVDDAKIIYESGSELLYLINEILDLSKIEAGRMTVTTELVNLPAFAGDIVRRFTHMATSKGLLLNLEISSTTHWQPFCTDIEKLSRIIKNFLSNAFKFTKKGRITLRLGEPPHSWSPPTNMVNPKQAIAILVKDTGIGIPADKCHLIFDAFQQADGSISRQFGGTGLGLTIATQLARLLNGTIHVTSEVGKGSIFTLIIAPLPPSDTQADRSQDQFTEPMAAVMTPPPFILNPSTVTPALPNEKSQLSAWGLDDESLIKPSSEQSKQSIAQTLLIIEDDQNARTSLIRLMKDQPVTIVQAATGEEALILLRTQTFACMILDLGLPDINGFDLLDQLAEESIAPATAIIVYSGQELTREAYDRLKKHTDSIVVKGNNSPTRLLNEITLVLNRIPSVLTGNSIDATIKAPHNEVLYLDVATETNTDLEELFDLDFIDKIVLLVDDDVRNAYAMTRQLERKKIKVHMAANGAKALEVLKKYPEINCVLMDIMMPVMDGLEAMRQLRLMPEHLSLPLIALTARSTDDDRRQAMEAGANDYLPKPIDMELLFTKLKKWIC